MVWFWQVKRNVSLAFTMPIATLMAGTVTIKYLMRVARLSALVRYYVHLIYLFSDVMTKHFLYRPYNHITHATTDNTNDTIV